MEPITRKEIYLNQIARNTGGKGGDTGLTPITREEHYFDAIVKNTASGGGGGGSDLPAVTSEDNGDVLTVVNGAWAKAAPSILIIHIVNGYFDKTWQEVYDAMGAGILVYVYWDGYGGKAGGLVQLVAGDEGDYFVLINQGESALIAAAASVNDYPYVPD